MFFRVLVQNDYRRERRRILLGQTMMMCGGFKWPVVEFTYSNKENAGRLELSFIADETRVENLPKTNGGTPSVSDTALGCTTSHGAMQLHLISVSLGAQPARTGLVMRIASLDVRNQLELIAHGLPAGTDESQLEELYPDIYKRIQVLLDTPVDEFH